MLTALKETANQTYTENGAVTLATTGKDCLDLFATIGALRHRSDDETLTRFQRAWAENSDLAMKLLFYARDVRGGLGERRVFRTVLHRLAYDAPESVCKNIENIAVYGRFDDLLTLFGTPCEKAAMTYIKLQLEADLAAVKQNQSVSLLAKWLPSVNASKQETVRMGKKIARFLGMSDAAYRKTLVELRARIRILENNLRTKDYTFDYAKQPSQAMRKYRQAFYRNDEERYSEFLEQVSRGEVTMHTGTLTPYEVITSILHNDSISKEERRALDVTWKALEDFTQGENALVVADGSGSMYWGSEPMPAAVAQSLAIYFAERNTGAFHNHFITFSENPQLVEIKGADIYEKVRCCMSYNECANTNIEAVFRLILKTAVEKNLPQSELPTKLYIISDMEFDACAEGAELTNFRNAKIAFEAHGYQMPKAIFWNVDSRNRQQPVSANEQGVALVSGCSPRIFSMVTEGNLNPYDLMLQVLCSERYAAIAA